MATPFKMKGSPMQRNFGIGSPLKKPTSTWDKVKSAGIGLLTNTEGNEFPWTAISRGYKEAKKEYRKKAAKNENE